MAARTLAPALQFLAPPRQLGFARARIAAAPCGMREFIAQREPRQRAFAMQRRYEGLGERPLGPVRAPLFDHGVDGGITYHVSAPARRARCTTGAAIRRAHRPATPSDRLRAIDTPTARRRCASPPRAPR